MTPANQSARRAMLLSVLLVAATIAAYWPIHNAEFTNFDDNQYVTSNPMVFRGVTGAGVIWAFTTFYSCNWHPLTWISHMVDCQVFGDHAAGHHWMNVGIHALNAVLLLLLLTQATGSQARSAFVAALFALHPLHVGTVAWIAERKDVLSTCFGLLSLWMYVRYVNRASRRRRLSYVAAWLFFALSLMSKPMLVTLPFVCLLLDVWPLRRVPELRLSALRTCGPLVLEKIPFLALSLASAIITFEAQKQGGAVVRTANVPLDVRLENAGISYVWYLAKTFWPAGLGPHYPYPSVMYLSHGLMAAGAVIALTVAVLLLARRAPYLFTGWFWYLGTLVPVIGIVQVGNQAMADRYTYIPLVGIFIMVVWGASELGKRWRYGRAVLVGTGAFAVAACGLATSVQAQYWRDSITLFQRALAVAPENNSVARHNLGHALALVGDHRDAIPCFREAMREHPDFAMCQFNWGNSVGIQGNLDEAIAHYRAAIQIKPDYEQAYYQVGNALALQLKLDEAKTNFLTAIHYKPDYAEAYAKLGNLLLLQGSNTEAVVQLREAVRLRPDYAEGQYYLGAALARQRNFAEAASRFRAAINAAPNYATPLNDLAWILATVPQFRDPSESVKLAERACRITRFHDPSYLDTLGVAYSETAQLTNAIQVTEQAATLAAGEGDAALASQLQRRIETYRAGRSYTGITNTPAAPR